MGHQACFPLAFALAAISASAGCAQPPPSAPPPPGSMPGAAYGRPMAPMPPLADFQARMRERMMEMDANHDGRISLQEWMAWHTAHPGRGGDPARQFQMMDRNRDGFITPDEIDAHSAQAYARRSARAAGGPAGGSAAYPRGPGPGAPQAYQQAPGAAAQGYPDEPQ